MPVTNQAKIVIVIGSQTTGAIAGLGKTQKAIQGVQKSGKGAAAALNQFGSAMSIALAPIANFGVALRQIGQALQGVSFLATAFISIPMVVALKAIASEAINYNAALVKVQKTTGLLDVGTGDLNKTIEGLDIGLRNLAKDVATPLSLLAELAEQAGQLGVRGADNILKFVRVAEIMGQTTDIAAKDALQVFGRLASALGVETERAGEFMLQLANAVNHLENTTTASAANIAQGMQNAISAAAGFKIAAADLAGFIASLFQAGIDAREAGTSFSRFAQYVAQNIEDLASLTGRSTAEIKKAFDTDFVGALVNVIEAIGKVESRVDQTAIASELFGKRAARGIVLLANNLDNLTGNIEAARNEFNEGTSIIDEYVKAMSSTEAQIGVLQNNLRVLGVTLGDTFLPIVNTLLKYVVPAIQMATEAFAALPEKVKLGVLAGAAFLAILGPLTMILGTLAFSIGIAISGVINLVTAMGSLSSIVLPAIAAIATFGAALIGLTVFAEDAVVGVRNTLESMADNARSWGSNLVANFASGMLQGAVYVIDAAIAIGNFIARFLRSFSPPRAGALKDIFKWGTNLINTYIKGFMSADFSAIEDVTNMIGRYFRDIAKLDLIDENQIVPNILKVRHAFVELVEQFNKTGEISETVLANISAGLGDMGEEMTSFLRLQLKVNVAQKAYDDAVTKLREIRDLRNEINRTYSTEVRAITRSGQPLLKQLSAIVEAQNQRDEGLAVLDEQEAEQKKIANAADKELDVQKELLKTQEGMIDFYLDELNLLAEQHVLMTKTDKAAKSAAGAAADFANALAGIDFETGVSDFEETVREWDELVSGIGESLTVFDQGRRTIEAFFAGLRGEFLVDNPELLENLTPETVNAIQFGRDIRTMWDGLIGTLDDVKEKFEGIGEAIGKFDVTELGAFSEFLQSLKDNAPYIIGAALGFALFIGLVKTFGTSFEGLVAVDILLFNLGKSFALAGAAIGDFLAFVQLALPFIGKFFLFALAIAVFVAAIVDNLGWLKDQAIAIWNAISDATESAGLGQALADLGQAFADLWGIIGPILGFLFIALVKIATIILQTFVGTLGAVIPSLITIFTGALNIVSGFLGIILGLFKTIWGLIVAVFTGDTTKFEKALEDWIGSLGRLVQGLLQVLGGLITGAISFILGAAINLVSSILQVLGLGSEEASARVITAFTNLANGVNEWIGKAKDWVVGAATTMWEVMGPLLRSLGVDWGNLATDTTNASTHIKVAAKNVVSETKTMGEKSITPLQELINRWFDVDDTASTTAGNVTTSTGTMSRNIIGLNTDTKGPLDNLFGNLFNLGTAADGAVSDSEKSFDQYNNAINGISNDVGTTVETFQTTVNTALGLVQTGFGELDLTSETAMTNIGLDLGTFAKTTETTEGEVNTSLLDIGDGVQTLYDTFDDLFPKIYGPEGFLQKLSDTFDTVTTDIAGDDGYIDLFIAKVEELALSMIGEGGEWDGYLGKIKKGWHDLGSYIGGVVGTLQIDVDNLLKAMKKLYDDSVNHSYIPDMAKGVVKWFNYMADKSLPIVTDWTSDVGGQMAGMSIGATGAVASGGVASGSDGGGFMQTGPMIQIDKMIIPNQNVARVFAQELSDQLGQQARWRRTGS